MILVLGVVETPYRLAASPKGKGRPRKVAGGQKSTGDVATWLENEYHVMEHFYQHREEEICGDLENSLAGMLENEMMGAPTPPSMYEGAMSKIQDRFHSFLENQEMDALGYPGIPTKASLQGVSHRFAHPYAKRGPRPSFIDTGLYENSFTTWIEEE